MAGRTIGLELQRRGHGVLWFDPGEEFAATKASAGVVFPPWLPRLRKREITAGLHLLRQFYPVHELTGMRKRAWRVAAFDVLDQKDVTVDRRGVAHVDHLTGDVTLSDGAQLSNHYVVLCAGAWTNQLYTEWNVRPMAGTAVRYKGTIETPLITPWAPYKQLVVFNERPGVIWASDGTSLRAPHYTMEHVARTDARVRGVIGERAPLIDFTTGWRPYRPQAGIWFERLSPRVWIATAGNKSTTIYSAVWAQQIVDDIKEDPS